MDQGHLPDVVITGHLHRNNYKKIGNTELVSTGPVGFPLGEDPSGIRHVRVDDNSLTHEYLGLISQQPADNYLIPE